MKRAAIGQIDRQEPRWADGRAGRPLRMLTANIWSFAEPCAKRQAFLRRGIVPGPFHECQKFARVRACRVVFDNPLGGVWPSDHFGVFAEIETARAG